MSNPSRPLPPPRFPILTDPRSTGAPPKVRVADIAGLHGTKKR